MAMRWSRVRKRLGACLLVASTLLCVASIAFLLLGLRYVIVANVQWGSSSAELYSSKSICVMKIEDRSALQPEFTGALAPFSWDVMFLSRDDVNLTWQWHRYLLPDADRIYALTFPVHTPTGWALQSPVFYWILLFAIAPLLWHWKYRERSHPEHACKACGYDLRGTIEAGHTTCPECGAEFQKS